MTPAIVPFVFHHVIKLKKFYLVFTGLIIVGIYLKMHREKTQKAGLYCESISDFIAPWLHTHWAVEVMAVCAMASTRFLWAELDPQVLAVLQKLSVAFLCFNVSYTLFSVIPRTFFACDIL
ncbi:unnamed protein product [Caenorhabditis sp. 36 PRJEB53466]|nr:unnamed protein product [Caenorhabditis sp. 36 PRJEB53466]